MMHMNAPAPAPATTAPARPPKSSACQHIMRCLQDLDQLRLRIVVFC